MSHFNYLMYSLSLCAEGFNKSDEYSASFPVYLRRLDDETRHYKKMFFSSEFVILAVGATRMYRGLYGHFTVDLE